MAIKPKILVQGNNLKCVHREYIEGNIGTCVVCGRDYGQREGPRFNTDLKVQRDADHEYYLNLIKSELDKLTVIDNDKKIKVTDVLCEEYKIRWGDFETLSVSDMEQFIIKVYDNISETQLQHTKEELLELMGKIE